MKSPELCVSSYDGHIGILLTDGVFPLGTGDCDLIEIDGEMSWWLARLFVKPEIRSQGWGRKMIEEIKKHLSGHRLVVAPGGYNSDTEKREKFYKSVGFEWNEDCSYMILKVEELRRN